MGVIPIELAPAAGEVSSPRRRRLPLPRSPILAPTRTLLLVALAAIAVAAPEGWLRFIAGLAVLLVAYAAGLRDGRADMALDAFLRGDEPPPDRPPRAGSYEAGE